MEDKRKEQIEALQVLEEFNTRLVKNIGILIKELSGQRLDDTDTFLKSIIDAINWEIQVVNSTLDILNEGTERLDKELFNQRILELSKALEDKDDAKLAQTFTDVLPSFEQLGAATNEVLK